MAAYAQTTTLPDLKAKKIAATGLGILRGSIALSNYNSTLAEITEITGKFRSAPTVLLGAVSSLGYLVAWDTTSKAIKAFYPMPAHTHTLHFQTSAAANAVTAAANALRTSAAAFDVAGVANSSGEGGVVNATAIPGGEVAADVNVGTVQFVAFGPAP